MRELPGAVELAMRNPSVFGAAAIYRGRFAGHSPIDNLRRIAGARGYHWRAVVAPDSSRQLVAARATVEDQFSVNPGSIITAISGYSAQAAGFTFQLVDKGSGLTIASAPVGFAAGTGGKAPGPFPNNPLPLYLTDLLPLSAPGLVLVSVVNQATVANQLAVCIQIAEKD